MYLSAEKPRPIDFDDESPDMMIEVSDVISNVGVGEDVAPAMPKKRAETWVQEETRALISLRRETNGFFNTSKSNKHLWDQISAKMRDRGFDRSPTMCTDKWRNLLKEFKKAKHHHARTEDAKMTYYKEIEDILGEREKTFQFKASPPETAVPTATKVDGFLQFTDKGIDDTSISFGQVEVACGRQTLNLERRIDHEGDPLSVTAAAAAAEVAAVSGVTVAPWNWRETPTNGGDSQSYSGTGRVISVKWGDYTRRIGIEGSAEAIKEAIKSAFRFRTRRSFWLEDEDQVVRSLDKTMPLGNYTLHIDEGLVIKVCLYDESEHLPMHAEEKVFYTEDDYRDFLTRQGWTCLREFDGYSCFYNMDDLRPGAIYRGMS